MTWVVRISFKGKILSKLEDQEHDGAKPVLFIILVSLFVMLATMAVIQGQNSKNYECEEYSFDSPKHYMLTVLWPNETESNDYKIFVKDDKVEICSHKDKIGNLVFSTAQIQVKPGVFGVK